MAKMAIGHDIEGPWLKMTSDAYDPATEPDTNYASFRFNSRYAEVGYFDEAKTIAGNSGHFDINGNSVAITSTGNPRPTAPWVSYGSSNMNFTVTYGKSTHYYWYYNAAANFWGWRETSGQNGKTEYGYPTMADYYFTNASGWNYPNWWVSINSTIGGGNEWGSVASISSYYGSKDLTPYYFGTRGPRNSWTVSPVVSPIGGYSCTILVTPLPVDDVTPPPFAEGTPASGKRVISIDNSAIKIARKGFDTRTATDSQLIIGGGTPRMPVYMARRITLTGSQTLNITLPDWVPTDAHLLMQWNVQGQPRQLPSIWVGSSSSGQKFEIRWRILNGVLSIQNLAPYTYDLLFFVTSSALVDPLGGPAIRQGIADGEKFISIVQDDGVIAADSRFSYLPIIKSGVVTTGTSGASVSINFPDQGYIPFVWYSFCYRYTKWYNGTITHPAEDLHIGPRFFQNRYNKNDFRSNTARITSSSIVFSHWCSSFYEGSNLRNTGQFYDLAIPKYFRYYIFAIPDVQAN